MTQKTPKLTRRGVLKAAAATTGVAVGSGAITGFPTIWAQNIKDIVLRHSGPPVTAIPAIAEQASRRAKIWVSRSRCRQPNKPIY